MNQPIVHVIGTGGTIAGKLHPSGEVSPGLSTQELLDRVPVVTRHARVTVEDFLQMSSGEIGFREMLALGERVHKVLASGKISGIVVTHGTTTLEQSAYFLDTVLDDECPVVLTGAMRNPYLPSDDGPINLLNAVQVAACPRSRGLGVLVVMNGFIHTARDVTKNHSTNIHAFQSPEFGPLGAIDEDYVFYARRPFRRIPGIMPTAITARVQLIPFSINQDDVLERAVLEEGVDGLVVEELMLNARQLEQITTVMARGIPVVMANPFSCGRLPQGTYRRPGSESHLLNLGVIFAGTSPQKAKVKLAIALSAGMMPAEIRDMFHAEWQ